MKEVSIDVEKAINFIRDKGKNIDKLKLCLMLDENSDTMDKLSNYLTLQNPDGGIPFRMRKDCISTIGPTITFFKDFLILDKKDIVSEFLDNAVNFILENQHEDGFFEEPISIKNFDYSPWETPGTVPNRIYCTSIVLNFLLGLRDTRYGKMIQKCIMYLSRNWRDDTGFKSYPHALWNAIPSFIKIKGMEDSISLRGLEMLQTFQLNSYPSSSLVWMIESFINTDLEKHDCVSTIVELLEQRQLSDGRWASEDGEEYDPSTTLTVLLVLNRLNYI
ncbi:MAG: terpene cyclase/mutase family protein [Candidatus Heimdallarchaeota archaeon]|nr:terpene cyclase/mutase family protein [Candidatus Heimdallarchaeota archaeon]